MAVTVKIPAHLRRLAGTDAEMEVEGRTVLECLRDLVRRYPKLKAALFDAQGKVLLSWMVYVNDKPALRSSDLSKSVESSDIIGLFPIAAGG